MDERSAIPEKDAASTLPEEPVELITPVDKPQPGSAEQVEPSPEDPPPAEPPKKESIWKKHKGKIIGGAVIAFTALAAWFLNSSNNTEPNSASPSATPTVPEDLTYNKSESSASQDCLNEVTQNPECSEISPPPSDEGYMTILKTVGMIIVNMPATWHPSEEKKLQADELEIHLEPNQTLRNKHVHPYRVKVKNRDSSTSDDD